jgi:hypothetical protein
LRGRRSWSVSNFKSSGVVLYICTFFTWSGQFP